MRVIPFPNLPRPRCAVALALAVLLGGCVEQNADDFIGERIIPPDVAERLRPLATPAAVRPAPVPAPIFIDLGDKATLIYSCRQSRPEDLAVAIEGLISPEGSLQPSQSLNVLVVSDRADVVRGIARVLGELDRNVPQLLVEARVVEVTVNDDLETEIRNRLTSAGGDAFFQDSDATLNTPGSSPTNARARTSRCARSRRATSRSTRSCACCSRAARRRSSRRPTCS